MMLSDVMRAQVNYNAFLFAVIPGVLASLLGNFIANLAIYQRSEANLFRELEAG